MLENSYRQISKFPQLPRINDLHSSKLQNGHKKMKIQLTKERGSGFIRYKNEKNEPSIEGDEAK